MRHYLPLFVLAAMPLFMATPLAAGEFVPPPGWELKTQGIKGSAYARGDCGLVINELKPMNGPYEAAAEQYIDDAIKRLTGQGEQVVEVVSRTTLENTGAALRSFITRDAGGVSHINIRIVAEENGALRPYTYRCSSEQSFKENWTGLGRALVSHLERTGRSGVNQGTTGSPGRAPGSAPPPGNW
jgi:hypothetical protein